MLNEETRRKLREMNFGELVDALDLQEKQAEYLALPFDDRINLAVDYAYSAKYNAKVHRLIKAAKFRIAGRGILQEGNFEAEHLSGAQMKYAVKCALNYYKRGE